MSGLVGKLGAKSGIIGFNKPKRHQYTTLLNSWETWDQQNQTSSDTGLMVQNMGPIWIVSCAIRNTGISTVNGNSVIVNIANEFTLPGATVICGVGHFGQSSEDEYHGNIQITDSGNIYLYYRNAGSTGHYVYNQFMGLDQS